MQGQELPHAVLGVGDDPVVGVAQPRVPAGVREVLDQFLDALLDEEDPGRFEGLDESAGEPDRHTVVDPRVAAAAHPHPDVVGLQVGGLGPDELAQRALRLLGRAVVGGVDVAGAHPPVQRDRPDPPRVLRGRGGAGPQPAPLHVHGYAQGHRAVVGEGVLVGDERLPQRLVEQHPAEAGAVDEEIAGYLPVLPGREVADPAAVVADHVQDVVHDVPGAARRRVLGEEVGQQRRVELVRVGELGVLLGEAGALRGRAVAPRFLDIVLLEESPVQIARRPLGVADRRHQEHVLVESVAGPGMQPPVRQRESVDHPEPLEGVVEVMPLGPPVLESDAEFVRGVAPRHPLVLGEAEVVEEVPDGAERGLAHADRLDPVGFDEGHRDIAAEGGPQIRGRHPAGGAAADDDYAG